LNNKGSITNYEHLDILEDLWKSGLRAKKIMKYIEENGLPEVSEKALAKHGQRYWNEPKVEVEATPGDIEDALRQAESLGTVSRISVSKTGFNISITPKSVVKDADDIRKLPKAPRNASKRGRAKSGTSTHVIIPDTQIEPGRSSEHLYWASQYIGDNVAAENVKLIHLGDHWNMGSLSSYDKGKKSMEGKRYIADIEAGNESFTLLDSAIADRDWERHFLMGNHENRVNKAVESDAQIEGLLTTDHMLTPGWNRHDFLEPVSLDGVWYSHYWYNHNTGKPLGGVVDTRLKTVGHSFVMGHQQGLQWGQRYIAGKQQFGLVAGSFYDHDEDYKGPQGNRHWHGIIILHDVEDGSCESPQFISIDTLKKLYG